MSVFVEEFKKELVRKASRFIDDTKGESELQTILRGHLYIEHEIEKILRFVLVEPDVILNERFMFMNKLNLAIALGLIPKNRLAVHNKLNRLRNKYAHKLNFKLTEKDLNDLISVLPEDMRRRKYSVGKVMSEEITEEELGKTTVLSKLRFVLIDIWVDVMNWVHHYELTCFEEAVNRINELEKPPCKEELEKQRAEVRRNIRERFKTTPD